MKYKDVVRAKFIDRPNRFVAHADLGGTVETVHVKNTGRCREILVPGCDIILERVENKNRKTAYDLVAAYKDNFGLINIDSQAPNKIVYEWLAGQNPDYIKPEYTWGNSRLDFYVEKCSQSFLIEVKGCTLEIDKKGYFPDAPTVRGVKHLRELRDADPGIRRVLIFVIQMENVFEVYPNTGTHPEFGIALKEAVDSGVKVVNLPCIVRENEIFADNSAVLF